MISRRIGPMRGDIFVPRGAKEPTFKPMGEMSYREFFQACNIGGKFADDDEGDAVRAEDDWRKREERI